MAEKDDSKKDLASYGYLCQKFKSIRIDKGLTEDEMAATLDVTRSTITKVTGGSLLPSNKLICKAIERLGISPNYLFDKEDENFSKEAKKIARMVDELDVDGREDMVEMSRYLQTKLENIESRVVRQFQRGERVDASD